MRAMEQTLELGFAHAFVIHTPLMFIDKAQTWRLAERLGGSALIELIVVLVPHLLAVYRIRMARAAAARQRTDDLQRFQSLRDTR